jgi:hypothetical protein
MRCRSYGVALRDHLKPQQRTFNLIRFSSKRHRFENEPCIAKGVRWSAIAGRGRLAGNHKKGGRARRLFEQIQTDRPRLITSSGRHRKKRRCRQ